LMNTKVEPKWLPFLCQCKDCLELFSLEGLVNGDNQILKLESHRRVVHNGNSTYHHRCGGNEHAKGRLAFYPVLWFGRS